MTPFSEGALPGLWWIVSESDKAARPRCSRLCGCVLGFVFGSGTWVADSCAENTGRAQDALCTQNVISYNVPQCIACLHAESSVL